jgi:hypothetical protein
MPCAAWPEDFGTTTEEVLLNVREALRSDYALDWWEGDPKGNDGDGRYRSLFVRPRVQGVRSVFDPSWGGACTFLTPTGCSLTFEKRPHGGRFLEPKDIACTPQDDGKRGASLAWYDLSDKLVSIGLEVS